MGLMAVFVYVSSLIGNFSKKENIAVSDLGSNDDKRAVRSWYKYKTDYYLDIEDKVVR